VPNAIHLFPSRPSAIVNVHRELSNIIKEYSAIRQRYYLGIGTTIPGWGRTRGIAIAILEQYARKRQERFGEWVRRTHLPMNTASQPR
jgi:hypothetical protein